MVLKKIGDADRQEDHQTEHEIAELEKRIAELETRFDRIYDDRLDGLLSEKKFRELSEKCEAEQAKAEARLNELKTVISERCEADQNVDTFIEEIDRYDDISALDKEILNRLVESITVGDRIKTSHGSTQEITVNYRFIGRM